MIQTYLCFRYSKCLSKRVLIDQIIIPFFSHFCSENVTPIFVILPWSIVLYWLRMFKRGLYYLGFFSLHLPYLDKLTYINDVTQMWPETSFPLCHVKIVVLFTSLYLASKRGWPPPPKLHDVIYRRFSFRFRANLGLVIPNK